MKPRRKVLCRGIRSILILILLCLLLPVTVQAEEKKEVAVLPFRIHALEPLDYLQGELQESLSARLAERGFLVINTALVNKHPIAFLPVLESSDMIAIGKALGADWVIRGSLTQIGKKISLDLNVVDVSARRPPFSIFMVEDDIDRLPEAVERASKSIYNQIVGVVQIDSVQVKGNKRIEREAILAMIVSKKGDSLDYDQLDKDLRSVYKMGFFKDVAIEEEDGPQGKVITFKVTEKPSIAKISFTGNEHVKEDDLKAEIGIKEYSILNPSELTQSMNRLKEFYRQKGYYNVSIKEQIEELPNNEVSLVYKIKEGKKVYITKIEFIGNTKFDDDDLKDLMETNEKSLFSWITKAGLLDERKLEFDVHKIVSFYHNQGFIRAKAGEPKISYEEAEGLNITIEIIEGPQYTVNDVSVEGDLIRPAEQLLTEISITKEEFFNREIIRKDTMALRDIYADLGYAYADVAPLLREDDENSLVDITYKISKGKKVRFERIVITGNTITRDKVIRRELAVFEGDYFSGAGLARSTENLHRLGFFQNVEIQPKKGSQDDLMVLDIKVEEKPTGSFSIGAGYSSYENVIGMFNVAQNNLFGRGQKLVGSVRLGSRTQMLDIRFTEPWLFDKPLSAGIDLYKWENEYDEYTKDSLAGALRFGFPLPIGKFIRGNVRYGYDDADISGIQEDAALAIKEMEGKNLTSSITLGVSRDSKDRPWNTTKGSLNSLSFEYAGGILGGDVAFNKVIARSTWFFPLPWKTVFMAQGLWGVVRGRPEGKLPIYQKFQIGGINTVRGFEYYSISPRDAETGDKIGGEYMMAYTLEYRFPLLKEQGITGIVFFDAGNVFTDNEDAITVSGLRKAAGTGIRWYSPVGPLRIEYGWKLDKLPEESAGEWAFTMGGLF